MNFPEEIKFFFYLMFDVKNVRVRINAYLSNLFFRKELNKGPHQLKVSVWRVITHLANDVLRPHYEQTTLYSGPFIEIAAFLIYISRPEDHQELR